MPSGIYDRKLSKPNSGVFKKGDNLRENNSNWIGGRYVAYDGYVLIYCPEHPFCIMGKYIKEHRLIMEKHLGRYLKPSEKVHHINGNKQDNRIENLVLFSSNSEHIHSHILNGDKIGLQKGHPYYGTTFNFKKGHPKPKNAYSFPKGHPNYCHKLKTS